MFEFHHLEKTEFEGEEVFCHLEVRADEAQHWIVGSWVRELHPVIVAGYHGDKVGPEEDEVSSEMRSDQSLH